MQADSLPTELLGNPLNCILYSKQLLHMYLCPFRHILVCCLLELLKYKHRSQKHHGSTEERAGSRAGLQEGGSARPGLCQERTSPQHILWRARSWGVKVLRAPLPVPRRDTLKPLLNWISDSTKTPFVRTSELPGT